MCSSRFPLPSTGAPGGWVYFNLDDAANDDIARQAWVTTSMSAEGRYRVEMEAAALGNGCSAPVARSETARGS